MKKWKKFTSQKEILSQWRLRNFWMTLLEKQLSRMSFSIQNDPKASYKANKKNPLSQNCMSEKPAWFLCLLKLPLPEDLVGVTASERGLSPAVRTRVCAPGSSPRCARTTFTRSFLLLWAQPWLMAAAKSLGSWLKSAPLEHRKGNYCIPVYPRDLCKVGIEQPVLFTFLERFELQCWHRLEYWPLFLLGNNNLGLSLGFFFPLQVLPLRKM